MKNSGPNIRTIPSLSWEERRAMIEEYLSGNYTKAAIWKKYTGQSREYGHMLQWMRKLGYLSDDRPIPRKKRESVSQTSAFYPLKKENNDTDQAELQKRIQELEKQLKAAELKAEGYELMIEIAEKELNVPIRKKLDTK
jgi:hypothetical protein